MMKVLVAEKDAVRRRAITDALASLDEIVVAGAVRDLGGLVRALNEAAPDVLVSGTELIDATGLDVIDAARKVSPSPRIVVVGPDATRDEWLRHLAAGADRFVECDTHFAELRDVVTSLAPQPKRETLDDQLRLLGRLAAGVVHDLDSYLSSISSAIEMLELAPSDPQILGRLRQGADQANRLTRSFLEHVRGDVSTLEAIDLNPLVRRTVSLAARAFPPHLVLRLELATDLPMLRGNVAELEQLVLNLVLDAVDAMPAGGDLAIRTRSAGAALYLEVSDTGPGLADIAKGERRQVLQTGIQRVVDRQGGRMTSSPRRDCVGTIATVLLPIAAAPRPSA
ncbi:MAG: response regulator [Kofleriaceae bacterium]